jgi:hypothetical protein
MVASFTQCVECKDKGLVDHAPDSSKEKVYSIPCTRNFVGSYPIPKGSIKTIADLVDD